MELLSVNWHSLIELQPSPKDLALAALYVSVAFEMLFPFEY